MTILGAIVTAVGEFAFNRFVDEILSSAVTSEKAKSRSVFQTTQNWLRVKRRFSEYFEGLESRFGYIKILNMQEPIPLDKLFVLPRFYKRPAHEVFTKEGNEPERHRRRNVYYGNDSLAITAALKPRKLVILGVPGSGKSTVLKAITVSLCTKSKVLGFLPYEGKKIPVFVELRNISDRCTRLEDAILEQVGFEVGTPEYNTLLNLLDKGRCIVLLDALDEVPSNRQEHVASLVDDFGRRFHKNFLILSCRSTIYNFTLENFSAIEISDFDNTQKDEFVDKWFGAKDSKQLAIGVKTSLKTEKGLSDISTNPLLLSLLCILFENDYSLTSQRALVYKRCIEVLIREWDTSRKFRRDSRYERLSDDKRIAILAELACSFFKDNQRYFSEEELLTRLSGVCSDFGIDSENARDLLREIESHHGILLRVSAGLYGFSHYTIQEFLTAHHYFIHQKVSDIVDSFVKDTRWREVYLFAGGLLGSVLPLLERLNVNQSVSLPKRASFMRMLYNEEVRFDADSKRLFGNCLEKLVSTVITRKTVISYTDDTMEFVVGIGEDRASNKVPIRIITLVDSGFTAKLSRGRNPVDSYLQIESFWNALDILVKDGWPGKHVSKAFEARVIMVLREIITNEHHYLNAHKKGNTLFVYLRQGSNPRFSFFNHGI